MKKAINYIIIILSILSLGYIIYVQSKQGIRINGSDNVIDPFQYETGVFQDRYRGIDPMSTANHITESELQSRKFKKMSDLLIFTIPIILTMFFFNYRKANKSQIQSQNEALSESKIIPSLPNTAIPINENDQDKNEIVKKESFTFLYVSIGVLITLFMFFLVSERNNKQTFETTSEISSVETQIDSSENNQQELTAEEVPTDAEANISQAETIEQKTIDYTDKDALKFLDDYYSFYKRDFVFRNAKFKKIDNYKFEISVEECINKEAFTKGDFYWHAVLYDLQINDGKYKISELIR